MHRNKTEQAASGHLHTQENRGHHIDSPWRVLHLKCRKVDPPFISIYDITELEPSWSLIATEWLKLRQMSRSFPDDSNRNGWVKFQWMTQIVKNESNYYVLLYSQQMTLIVIDDLNHDIWAKLWHIGRGIKSQNTNWLIYFYATYILPIFGTRGKYGTQFSLTNFIISYL